MIRKIIHIDKEKCNGCGACAAACHEGAIGMVDGKAQLMREDYCDGLGDCLPACPTGAITFVSREAAAYDESAVNAAKAAAAPAVGGCPGMRAHALHPQTLQHTDETAHVVSQLAQWPVQIRLAPVRAPYFQAANLLIAADCTAYALGDFHNRFMRNHVTLIGCPKLDDVDYTEKLTEILRENDIRSLTIARMEVPCCGALERAAIAALKSSGKFIPWQIAIISTDGRVLD